MFKNNVGVIKICYANDKNKSYENNEMNSMNNFGSSKIIRKQLTMHSPKKSYELNSKSDKEKNPVIKSTNSNRRKSVFVQSNSKNENLVCTSGKNLFKNLLNECLLNITQQANRKNIVNENNDNITKADKKFLKEYKLNYLNSKARSFKSSSLGNNVKSNTKLNQIQEINDDNNDDEEPIKIDSITNQNEEKNKKLEETNNINNQNDLQLNTEKNNRRYTFDVNTFDINKNEEDSGSINKIKNEQSRKLQDFISNNEFLSKNVDFVDMHLKFLITGNDSISKHLFLNELLNEKNDGDEREYNSFNIYKKVIKLLGDYIKMELYEEDCALANSMMLDTYTNIVDCIFMIINLNVKNSSKYILNLMEKIKYKIYLQERHFTVTVICFEFNEEKDEDIIAENKKILNDLKNNYDITINNISFDINKDKGLKNHKFVTVINKYLSLAYLKKERKNKIPFDKNNLLRRSNYL